MQPVNPARIEATRRLEVCYICRCMRSDAEGFEGAAKVSYARVRWVNGEVCPGAWPGFAVLRNSKEAGE